MRVPEQAFAPPSNVRRRGILAEPGGRRQTSTVTSSGLILCCSQSRRDGIGVAQGGSPGNWRGYRRSRGEGRHKHDNTELAHYPVKSNVLTWASSFWRYSLGGRSSSSDIH